MIKNENPFCAAALQIYAITVLFYTVVYFVLLLLPFHAATHGASSLEVGFIMGATMLVSMAVRPIAGHMIDRMGSGTIFVVVLGVFVVSLGGYFLHEPWIFGIARATQGVVAAFFSTCMELIVIDLLSASARGRGLSMYSLATVIPTTFAPALALELKPHLSMEALFGGAIVFAAMTFVLALLVRRVSDPVRAAGQSTNPGTGPRSAEKYWARPVFLFPAVLMLLASLANGAIYTFLPLHLEALGSPYASRYFLVQTTALVACRFLARGTIPSDGRLPVWIMTACLALATAGSFLLANSPGMIELILAGTCAGVAFALLYPSLLTFVSFHVPDSSRGLFISLFIGAADLGFALGSLAMGVVAEFVSYSAVFYAASASCCIALVLGGVWILFSSRQHYRQRHPQGLPFAMQ